MKALIFAVILAAAGYVAYQYYNESRTETSAEPADAGTASYGYVPPIPAECEAKAGTMGDAIYGYDIGRVSVAQLNFATRSLQSCLRDAGFSDAEINAAYDAIKNDVMSLNPGSAQGY